MDSHWKAGRIGFGYTGIVEVQPGKLLYVYDRHDAYAEYDPDRANELLDDMGLVWDAAGEQRLRPDGQPLEYLWDYYPSEVPEKGPITEMCLDYWAAIGIKMTLNQVTRELLNPRIYANEEPMSLWHGDECNAQTTARSGARGDRGASSSWSICKNSKMNSRRWVSTSTRYWSISYRQLDLLAAAERHFGNLKVGLWRR